MSQEHQVSIPSYSGLLPYSSKCLMPLKSGSQSLLIQVSFHTGPGAKPVSGPVVSIPSYSGLLPYASHELGDSASGLNPFLFRSPSIRRRVRYYVGRWCLNPFLFRSPSIRSRSRSSLTGSDCLNPFLFRSPSIREYLQSYLQASCLNPFLFRSPSILVEVDDMPASNRSQSLLIQVSFHTALRAKFYLPRSLNPFLFRSPSIRT